MSTRPITSMQVLIRGGGDLGTGVAHRLFRCGFRIVISELPQPKAVRRSVSFASAVYEGEIAVEGVHARLASGPADVEMLLLQGLVPVVVDAPGDLQVPLVSDVLVDARLAKRNLGTQLSDAPIVIGLGPGLIAGQDVHAVVETNRGHDLGRVILSGSAQPDTGVPGPVQGYARERVLWAPSAGLYQSQSEIGQWVSAGQIVAQVDGQPVHSAITGVLRGLLHSGLWVESGQKLGDVDPRGITEYCFTISDKARAIAGGVLEAILYLQRQADRRELTKTDTTTQTT